MGHEFLLDRPWLISRAEHSSRKGGEPPWPGPLPLPPAIHSTTQINIHLYSWQWYNMWKTNCQALKGVYELLFAVDDREINERSSNSVEADTMSSFSFTLLGKLSNFTLRPKCWYFFSFNTYHICVLLTLVLLDVFFCATTDANTLVYRISLQHGCLSLSFVQCCYYADSS